MRTRVIVRSDSWRVSRSKGNDTGAGMGNSLSRFWLGAGGVILVHLILISSCLLFCAESLHYLCVVQ